jgi:hypothetical protein
MIEIRRGMIMTMTIDEALLEMGYVNSKLVTCPDTKRKQIEFRFREACGGIVTIRLPFTEQAEAILVAGPRTLEDIIHFLSQLQMPNPPTVH